MFSNVSINAPSCSGYGKKQSSIASSSTFYKYILDYCQDYTMRSSELHPSQQLCPASSTSNSCCCHIASKYYYRNNIIDIGEVTHHIAIIKHINRFATENLLCKHENRHVRSTPAVEKQLVVVRENNKRGSSSNLRSINSEESQTGALDSKQMPIRMCHQFVCLLCRSIQTRLLRDV